MSVVLANPAYPQITSPHSTLLPPPPLATATPTQSSNSTPFPSTTHPLHQRAVEYAAMADGGQPSTETAEQQLAALQRQLQASNAQLEAAQEQNRASTFVEMLDLYHQHTSIPLKVVNPAQSTKGNFTNPKGRYYPTKLRPWTDFLLSQQGRFEKLRDIWPTQRLFAPRLAIDHEGRKYCGPLSSEQGVRLYTWVAVETNVRDIFAKLLTDDNAKASINLVGGVKFESHLNVLSDSSEEVRERKVRPAERAFIPVDQYSIIERTDGNDDDDDDSETTLRDILFLIEYKAAYKLTVETLRRVLGNGDFDIKNLINSPKVDNDDDAKEQYRSEMEAAAAISQLFGYMVRAGTEYGYVTTGKSFLFLRVMEDEPTTAYYYLAVPNEDVNQIDLSRTSISQVLCFSLLALESKPRDQQWIRAAMRDCEIWATDEEEVLSQMSPEKPTREPKDSAYRSSGKSDVMSSYGTRSKDRPNDSSLGSNDTTSDSSCDRSDAQTQSTSSQVTTQSKTSSGTSQNVGLSQRSASEEQSLPFCSHQCLLGLVCGSLMDTNCPNYDIHPKVSCDSSAGMHSLDLSSLQDLLRNQLAETMDVNCTPMRKQGARGAMFKLTLASHGYTIVGKGTVRVFVPDLRRENQFYDRLRSVQGSIVPVCMGSIDCVYPYYYHFATEIVHFLLLSWAGESMNHSSQACWDSHASQIVRMDDQLWRLGVAHGDIRPENVLWNQSLGQLMFIDFERSRLVPQKKATPTELASSSPPLTATSKPSDSSVYADNMRRFELRSSPTKKRTRSSSADDTIHRKHYNAATQAVQTAELQMV